MKVGLTTMAGTRPRPRDGAGALRFPLGIHVIQSVHVTRVIAPLVGKLRGIGCRSKRVGGSDVNQALHVQLEASLGDVVGAFDVDASDEVVFGGKHLGGRRAVDDRLHPFHAGFD